ncbi:hypothetical protein [Burkholderia savannae]|uniref:hypothetical protein n=1 Tax=Burkholderia savannae TaxID=1637837 RepID=UPI00075884BD|nr:hypothetical protein [Burkholderia savannae]KVG37481.1 hypothetical protein WS77_02045 [Burkholderia sp. MSMB0265]KVG88255.1 hypothetical protein WS81_25180 [Burkholderia sp. MSMB2040]KVG93806.1 hypothetical protein WS82_08675 [Burkholderia sp. MSMB2041]KVH01058.1 hypothetical protein WS83_20235 [Burkholderia sp. MSMB2042]AOJ69362.1 hypothetical protein WS78_11815 [Burkholderia savannae]
MDTQPLVNLQVPQPEQTLFKSATNALEMAKAYTIDSADMRDLAARELTKIKGLQKDVEAKRKGITQPIDAAKKAVMDLFRAPTDYLEQAEALLKKAIQGYDREQERLRIAEQARLEEAARQERARLEQEAAAREAAAQAEAQAIQRQAEQAAAAGDVESAARLNAEAESRVEQGAAEVATLQTTATLVTAPVVAAPVRTAGVSTRKVWKAEVSDKLALIRYVAAHPEYVDLLDANMPAVNKIALALKKNCPLDGVHVFEDDVIAARAA